MEWVPYSSKVGDVGVADKTRLFITRVSVCLAEDPG